MRKATFIGAAIAAVSTTMVPSGNAAVIVNFDTGDTLSPYHYLAVQNKTSVTGSVTDPAYNAGAGVTFDFKIYKPLKTVNITTPAAPDFSGAVVSFFGAEGTGFGVAEGTLGRFDRTESFAIAATQKMTVDTFRFHEYSGDEVLQISWTAGGVGQSGLFAMAGGVGTPPSNVTVTLAGIVADANTDIVVTNVSPNTNNAGRLRIRSIGVTAVPEPVSLGLLLLLGLAAGRRVRR